MEKSISIKSLSGSATVDFDSTVRLLIAASWLKECIEGHPSCTISSPEFMPNRLVDVGLEGSELFLNDSKLDAVPYIALSYCWGNVQNTVITTRQNIVEHRRCIPLSLLP